MSGAEEIVSYLEARGVEAGFAQRLGSYGKFVLDANQITNLTAARSPEAFAEHILDSLTLTGYVTGALIDIGSGAGLPGIPLAIATGQPVTLVESVKKKAAVLEMLLRELDLQGRVVDSRAERLGSDPAFRERYQAATARAVSTAPTVAELTLPFVALGGLALLQRGLVEDKERQALMDAAPMLGARFIEERRLVGDRRIFVFEKVSTTPGRFPRRDGIPEKRPLCLA